MNLQCIKCFILALSTLLIFKQSQGQVTPSDEEMFARNLNLRKESKIGVNPNTQQALQVPFGELNYKGVDAVSSKFMLNAYPNENPLLVEGLFTTLGLDKAVFDKFMFQIFLYCDADKDLTSRMIEVFCDDYNLSQRIFVQYWKENKILLQANLKYNPYFEEIKERNPQKETTNINTAAFNIPAKSEDGYVLKDKDLITINFSTTLAQVEIQGHGAISTDKQWKIEISSDLVNIQHSYLDGFMSEEYKVVNIKYDSIEKAQEFLLESDLEKSNDLNHPNVTHKLKLYWDKSVGYIVKLSVIKPQQFQNMVQGNAEVSSLQGATFLNNLIVTKKIVKQ